MQQNVIMEDNGVFACVTVFRGIFLVVLKFKLAT